MSKRPYFPIYHDDMDSYSHLSDRDLGTLLRLLYEASLGGDPEPPRRLLSEYNTMVKRVRKDAEAYDKKVEQATKASHSRRKPSDDIVRYRATSDDVQLNLTQLNSTHSKNNAALAYSQRDDDMSDVMMDM